MGDVPKTKVPVVPGAAEAQTPTNEELLALLAERAADQDFRTSLRKDRTVAGIAGEIGDALASRKLAAAETKAAEDAIRTREAELLRLAETDPDTFADTWLREKRTTLAAGELAELESKQRAAIATQIGHATKDLPEMQALSNDELAELAHAVAGLPDHEVIPAYTRAVIDLVAHKRTAVQVEADLASRVKVERDAWDADQSARLVKANPAPDLQRGQPVGGTGEPDFLKEPVAWDKWYRATMLGQRT